MKKLLLLFRKVRIELRILLVVAVTSYFCIELWWVNYEELFTGASKIGEFFSKISIAYITAFIFYFLVIHMGRERDKDNINVLICQKVSQISACGHLMIVEPVRVYRPKASLESISVEEFNQALYQTKKFDLCPSYQNTEGTYTWVDFYESMKRDTVREIAHIMTRYTHLDSELIKLLSQIEDSLLFKQMMLLRSNKHDDSLGFFELQLNTYRVKIEELDVYYQKHLVHYQSEMTRFLGYRDYMDQLDKLYQKQKSKEE